MRLTFLGTGAAEGYPAPFCRCENCAEARRRGGKSVRLRASLLVNDDLLIDFGDMVAATALYGVDLADIETMLITHRHTDHLQPDQLFIRAYPFAKTPVLTLHIYGPHDAIEMLEAVAGQGGRTPEDMRFESHIVAPGRRWTSGHYEIRALHANHGTADPLLYVVDDGERSLFYSTDTGLYPAETWEMIREGCYDAVVIDETMGRTPVDEGDSHLNIEAVLRYRRAFEDEGLLKPGARFIAHHFSHGANPHHEALEEILGPHGVEVAYDGWRIEI
ncbi:MAG TPA: MBL fold metallo-hydrolase [Chloroflexi bacterium]|jgi:phosphoribosyl 1,2-cyclic phosphate phosphodiesterase|nr:MBL fold metallo-hydrolase [Chloroflexota bacterium]